MTAGWQKRSRHGSLDRDRLFTLRYADVRGSFSDW